MAQDQKAERNKANRVSGLALFLTVTLTVTITLAVNMAINFTIFLPRAMGLVDEIVTSPEFIAKVTGPVGTKGDHGATGRPDPGVAPRRASRAGDPPGAAGPAEHLLPPVSAAVRPDGGGGGVTAV